MVESEPPLTDDEVPVTGSLSKLTVEENPGQEHVARRPTTMKAATSTTSYSSNMSVPSLPHDILDLIFASLCPPPPSQWIHGTRVSDSTRGKPRHAPPPCQPPDIIWPEDSRGNGDGYPANTLLLETGTGMRGGSTNSDTDAEAKGVQNPDYVEYKIAMRTLAAVARTSSWARELAERYLYRYVVLVRGRQLAGFVAAVEGRFGFVFGLGGSARQGNSEGDVEDGFPGFSRLGRYVWGVYCFVDMMRREDLAEWYRFEIQLREWKGKRLGSESLQSGPEPVGEIEGQEGGEEKEGETKKKKKRKNKEGKGKGNEKVESVSDKMRESRKEADGKGEEDQATPPHLDDTSNPNHIAAPGASSSTAKTAKASSSSARRNRRKKAQKTDHLIKPLDETGTFFRLHSAMLESDMYERSSEGMSLSPRNLYNLFLRLLLSPSGGTLLPNLTDLLCSWYIIERVSGMIKEPDYLSSWIPGRVTLHPRPAALHKIKTFTIRPPVKHPADRNTPFTAFHDVQPTLGGILDALPNLETFDTVFLSSCRSWGGWLYRPLLEARETASERRIRLESLRAGGSGGGSGTHPLKHIRVYRTSCSVDNIAAFLRNLAPGSLETLLVRFRHFAAMGLGVPVGTILLGHEALVDNGVKDSLRYLELVSTPSRHFLTRTTEMQTNPRLMRLTCLPYLEGLEELVVDFQGLFGHLRRLGGLKEEDMDLLRRDACLPPNLETLKVLCVWSSGTDEWFYISPPVGEYVVSGEDVAMFVAGFWKAHREGLLRCCKTLRRLVLVAPERLKRISAVDGGLEGIERARAREGVVIEEAGRYFEANGVDFVVERGMDVLDSAKGT